ELIQTVRLSIKLTIHLADDIIAGGSDYLVQLLTKFSRKFIVIHCVPLELVRRRTGMKKHALEASGPEPFGINLTVESCLAAGCQQDEQMRERHFYTVLVHLLRTCTV